MTSFTLRALSRMMAYPEQELILALPEIREVLAKEGLVPDALLDELLALVEDFGARPLLDQQEEYVNLFDRGRALSLHLFEHVHGESRDRGQAMVDLLSLYQDAGLELDARELPDYLPLMLEYLSTRDRAEMEELLGDAMGVIVLIAARLRERSSRYAVLFDVLEALAGSPIDAADLRRAAASEGPDPSIERMDEIWEEEQVTFMGNNAPDAKPGGGKPAPESQPVRIIGLSTTANTARDGR